MKMILFDFFAVSIIPRAME